MFTAEQSDAIAGKPAPTGFFVSPA